MSRKNKTLRAFLHNTPNATLQDAWDAAWKAQGSKVYSLRIRELEAAFNLADSKWSEVSAKLEAAEAKVARLVKHVDYDCEIMLSLLEDTDSEDVKSILRNLRDELEAALQEPEQ